MRYIKKSYSNGKNYEKTIFSRFYKYPENLPIRRNATYSLSEFQLSLLNHSRSFRAGNL
jgi:hypothetical protein